MKGPSWGRRILLALKNYAAFFLLIAFLITCCMELFLYAMRESMAIAYTETGIRTAAILTFANVLLLSLLCTLIDAIRRKITVERPVRRIAEGAKKIMRGDFSVRIEPVGPGGASGLDTVIDCFNRMAAELGGLETLRTDFVANVSHELKTPLSVIQNYGRLLQSPDLDENQRMEYAAAITESSRRLADLITNILRLNRLENQQIYPDVCRFDLGEQLAECLLGFEQTWEQKGILLDTDIEEGVFVESDGELLSLVWNNLFSNALKFTDRGGRVTVSLQTDGDFALVRVADTGCGISPETGKHIFEKFYQGDPSHASQGNGLGLALVKRVSDIVGGEISVESEVGKGSTFTVKIRRSQNEENRAKT